MWCKNGALAKEKHGQAKVLKIFGPNFLSVLLVVFGSIISFCMYNFSFLYFAILTNEI